MSTGTLLAANSPTNALLAALPRAQRELIEPYCLHVTLASGEIVARRGTEIEKVLFPTDALLALTVEDDAHDTLAVGLTGSEGMLGASLALGGKCWPLGAQVQSAGGALCIDAERFRTALADTPLLERELRLYADVALSQVAQVALCAAFHVVVRRVAYWLLLTHDRSPGDRFSITHELLSHLLGVRRSGVTAAAGELQRRNLIAYTRGRVVVLDRDGLEHAACGCYAVSRDAFKPLANLAAAIGGPGEPATERWQRIVQGAEVRRRVVPGLRKVIGGH
jgi:CRP-like cAMP-binding protein